MINPERKAIKVIEAAVNEFAGKIFKSRVYLFENGARGFILPEKRSMIK